jgi:MYXO-CTERM domain-containing protein
MPLPVTMPPMTIEGDVVATHSYWTDDGSRIVTEATVQTPQGAVVVSQLGGSVDGIAMVTMPGPTLLVPGMTVAVAAHRDLDLEQQEHVLLDSVKVLAYPPDYVRTSNKRRRKDLYWASGCIFVTVDAAGTVEIAGDGEFAIIDAAIATWNDDTASCSYMKVMNEGRKALEVGNDRVNLIKFRDTVWGRPAVGKDPARMYAPAAAGITTAVFVDDPKSSRDGEIIDADIELNGVNFTITADSQPGNPRDAVQQNTLTHEIGHLHGLEHPCVADGELMPGDLQRVDNQGNPVPSCSASSLDPRITEATMYNFQTAGETKKETLSDDDIQAMCDIYPIATDPHSCAHVAATGAGSGCSCSASGGPAGRPDVGLLLAGTTVLITLRRRRTSSEA